MERQTGMKGQVFGHLLKDILRLEGALEPIPPTPEGQATTPSHFHPFSSLPCLYNSVQTNSIVPPQRNHVYLPPLSTHYLYQQLSQWRSALLAQREPGFCSIKTPLHCHQSTDEALSMKGKREWLDEERYTILCQPNGIQDDLLVYKCSFQGGRISDHH